MIRSILNKRFLLADQALVSGFSFINSILIARVFGIENYGIYASVLLGVYFAMNILNSIVIQPMQVNLSKHDDQNDYIIFNLALQISLLAIIILGFLAISYLLNLNINTFSIYIFAVGVTVQDLLRKIFIALSQLKTVFLVDLIFVSTQTIVLLVFSFISLHSVWVLMFWQGLAYVFPFAVALIFLSPFSIKATQWKAYAKFHYKEGRWLLAAAVVQWSSSNLFVVAAGYYISIKALGALRLCQTIFGVLNVLLVTYENYALPQTAKILNDNQVSAVQYLKKISKQLIIAIVPILLIVFIFSDFLIGLIGGSEFTEYSYIMKGMALLYIFILINQPIRVAVKALVLNKHFFFAYALSLVFSLIASDFLLRNYEVFGALTGLIASQIILFLYLQRQLKIQKFTLWKSFI